jgi:DNA-binding transcriptional LysR family regulator
MSASAALVYDRILAQHPRLEVNMGRLEVNRSGEMEVFTRVVELGGFSSAARACRMTPSAVSKLIARLEARLGVRLINRSTRSFQLTFEGSSFYQRSRCILADLGEAERNAASGEHPVGRVRLNAPPSFGIHILAPLVPEFLARYPKLGLDIVQSGGASDAAEEWFDASVLASLREAPGSIAHELGAARMKIVAAPSYLDHFGRPKEIEDLKTHCILELVHSVSKQGWSFRVDDRMITVPIDARVRASDSETLRHLAIGGTGLARLADFTVKRDIAEGRLVAILDEFCPEDREVFRVAGIDRDGPQSIRARAMLDFLAEKARAKFDGESVAEPYGRLRKDF